MTQDRWLVGDGATVLHEDEAIALIKSLFGKTRPAIRSTPYDKGPSTAVIDITRKP